MDLLRKLLDGKDAIARSKGLVLFGNEGASERRRPWKTTVVPGLRGLAAIRDDLRWAEAFSKQGFAFIALDEPGVLFGGGGLSEEGKKILEALEKTNLLLIADGLDAAQSVALLENIKKPVFLRTAALPGDAVLDLAKKTGSTIGLVLGKEQAAASYRGESPGGEPADRGGIYFDRFREVSLGESRPGANARRHRRIARGKTRAGGDDQAVFRLVPPGFEAAGPVGAGLVSFCRGGAESAFPGLDNMLKIF